MNTGSIDCPRPIFLCNPFQLGVRQLFPIYVSHSGSIVTKLFYPLRISFLKPWEHTHSQGSIPELWKTLPDDSQAGSYLAHFLVHPRITCPRNYAAHSRLACPIPINRVIPHRRLVWVPPQLRLPSQVTLSCVKLTLKTN